MKENLDFGALFGWVRSVDAGWLFLLILAFVVIVVGLWSRDLGARKTKDSNRE